MHQNQDKNSIDILLHEVLQGTGPIECSGLSGSDRSYLVSKLFQSLNRPLFVVLPSPGECETFINDLRYFAPSECPVIHFPIYNITPFKFLSYHNETAADRIRSLYRMVVENNPMIVVTTVEALLQKLIPRDELCGYAELLMVDEDLDRDVLIEKLVSGGYVRSMIVEEPGDFCVRGGIVDILTPLYPDPIRIEFFGDTIESLRFFSAETQRTKHQIREAVILPAREIILKKENVSTVTSRIRTAAADVDLQVTQVRAMVDRIKSEGIFPGIESLISIVYDQLSTFFDYIPRGSRMILIEPEKLIQSADEVWEQAEHHFIQAREKGKFCVKPICLYMKWQEARQQLTKFNPILFRMLPLIRSNRSAVHASMQFHYQVGSNSELTSRLMHHNETENLFQPLSSLIEENNQTGRQTVMVCRTVSQADRLASLLAPYGLKPPVVDKFPENLGGGAAISLGSVSKGFAWPEAALVLIAEDEIFGIRRRRKKSTHRKVHTELLSFEELKQDDLVVHSEHGIGRYNGLVKLKLDGTANDFLLIVYRDDDKLYLPVDRMNMVQKYMGVDGITPVLDKMGGKSWDRLKKKVKKSVEKIAGELLKLYASRKVQVGHEFSTPGSWFQEFEAGFPYEETADQLKAIDQVLQDMESERPMDRLVCGDVGYGKTEVALRASFLAVHDGKQVAVLVPTTVLAEQHYETFLERYEHYPVTIECLSRFRTSKEQKRIVEDLKHGKVDIVIGTHRLLQKDVAFRDIGLLVIDEEQRFGVRHKEILKQLRKTVDVLALTATPIPRTLHMSLMGVRDISVISTPPEDRRPIITYISEFDESVIKDAVRRELKRNGQIFFVHNSINTMGSMANYLRELVPELRLGTAHGRLDEQELERTMMQFVRKEIDLLVCTTIIESGLDIPSANTIIVNRADRFGLAQMYQLRGRVGRSEEQAYAYLFIPKDTSLSKDSQKRLKVLMEYCDLGSGFQIAMNDMRIRGGGSILGASQSGHIAAVGYDMFLKLMEEAVSDLKGTPIQEGLEPEINMTMSAFIPEHYVPDIDQRLSIYRRLSRASELRDLSDFRDELKDRFGELPVETENLLLKIMLKTLCVQAGVRRLDVVGSYLALVFSEAHQKNPFGIVDLLTSGRKDVEFTPDHVLKVRLSKRTQRGQVAEIKNVLKEIFQRVNG